MLLLLSILLLPFCICKDSFKENLFISNFNEAISFHFDFQTTTSDLTSHNYHLFPKSISEIIERYSVSEMHLSLSKGFWDTDKWGLQPVPVPSESAELWAWFEQSETKIDEKWDHLSHALSGLFCASLNKLSNKMERISPIWAYSPQGLTNKIRNNSYIRKSTMSGETVCTENLTPWIKLLPCKKLAGLAQLMKPSRLFSSHFTSITVEVKKICLTPNCDTIGRMLHQTITLVLDRKIFGNFQNVWTMHELLNTSPLIKQCTLADVSRVYVHGFGNADNLRLVPTLSIGPDNLFCYDIKQFAKTSTNVIDLHISGHWPPERHYNNMAHTFPLTLTKFSTGSGNIEGGIKAVIRSNSDKAIRVVYEESLQWYFQFYLHSLRVEINNEIVTPERMHYRPSVSRQCMTHLELVLTVPPSAVVTIQYRFKKMLQNWNEYPPDANHEFHIGASSISFEHRSPAAGRNNSLWDVIETVQLVPGGTGARVVRLYSEVVLVTMPCPDFSMPFNALCLACTVLAIMVGGLHKYTTSSVHAVDARQEGLRGRLVSMVSAARAFLADRRRTPVDASPQ